MTPSTLTNPTLPVSSFALRRLSRDGLLLGYVAFPPDVLRKSMRDLGAVIRKSIRPT